MLHLITNMHNYKPAALTHSKSDSRRVPIGVMNTNTKAIILFKFGGYGRMIRYQNLNEPTKKLQKTAGGADV